MLAFRPAPPSWRHVRRTRTRSSGWLVAVLLTACLPDNPSTSATATEGTSDGSAGTATTGDADWPTAGPLGCAPGASCTFVLATQTLDDRIELFGGPSGAVPTYRGTLDLDLKPNRCAGCVDGDNGVPRLDEPYGVHLAGGALHAFVGHYPSREAGSWLQAPIELFDGAAVGATIPASAIYDPALAQAVAPAQIVALEEQEAIFSVELGDDLALVGVFANDLFATEDSWTNAGRLLLVDLRDPTRVAGRRALTSLDGGRCDGAASIVRTGEQTVAIACDGNEAVALLDLGALDRDGDLQAQLDGASGRVCEIPATSGKRVRFLAPDGEGGVIVAESPTTLGIEDARLWWFGADCSARAAPLQLDGSAGAWLVGELAPLPGVPGAWIAAVGGPRRGLWVVRREGAGLVRCEQPIAGFDTAWTEGVLSEPIDPIAIAIGPRGDGAAIGAGPFVPERAVAGYGKVLWATWTVDAADPCATAATVVDLTDGGEGRAPAVAAGEPSTWRRGPNVVRVVEVTP